MDIYTAMPSNLAIVAGKPLRLECGAANASKIHWYFQNSSTNAKSVLFYNGVAIIKTFAGDFSVDNSSAERRDLIAKEAKLEHAGVYECAVLISEPVQKHSAKSQVIVLGK